MVHTKGLGQLTASLHRRCFQAGLGCTVLLCLGHAMALLRESMRQCTYKDVRRCEAMSTCDQVLMEKIHEGTHVFIIK